MTYQEKCTIINGLEEWANFISDIEGSEVGEFWGNIAPLFSQFRSGILDDEKEEQILNIFLANVKETIQEDWFLEEAESLDWKSDFEFLKEKYPL